MINCWKIIGKDDVSQYNWLLHNQLCNTIDNHNRKIVTKSILASLVNLIWRPFLSLVLESGTTYTLRKYKSWLPTSNTLETCCKSILWPGCPWQIFIKEFWYTSHTPQEKNSDWTLNFAISQITNSLNFISANYWDFKNLSMMSYIT